jgi:hypothetical protein
MLACDFFHAGGHLAPRYVFVVIEAGTRPVPVLSVTTHLDRARTVRQAPNLLTDLN